MPRILLEPRDLIAGDRVSLHYDTRIAGGTANSHYHIVVTDVVEDTYRGEGRISVYGDEILPHVLLDNPFVDHSIERGLRFFSTYINRLQWYNNGDMDSPIVPVIDHVQMESNHFYLISYTAVNGRVLQRIVKIDAITHDTVRVYNYSNSRHINLALSSIHRAVEVVPFRNEYGGIMNYDYIDASDSHVHMAGGFSWAEVNAPRLSDSLARWQGPRIPAEWSENEVVL